MSTQKTKPDWRIELFGPLIQRNVDLADEEAPAPVIPTETAFDTSLYDYIAIFIGANYCPHCKEFAPTVVASASMLKTDKRTKVVFVSNDRDAENFQISCEKVAGIDVMPYNVDKTKAMRDMFDLKTIPALMILRNKSFDQEPIVVSNARHSLKSDPQGNHFPWKATEKASHETPSMTAMERLIISGKYGKWWELGHHANPENPQEMYMDEHAVRARAGILNVISWVALMNIFFMKEPILIKILFPVVAWEFLTSMTLGLSPLAPIGVAGTLISILLHPEPHWKPASPKRFAWLIGLTLAVSCLTIFTQRDSLGSAYKPAIASVALMCNLATWLESSCGFCLGCFIYNKYLTKWFDLEECKECKL